MEERHRYFIELGYDGTSFFGWQIQPHDRSVQGVLQEALSTILRTEVGIVGAGRTDTGVHARKMIAHFDLPSAIDAPQLVYKLNRYLYAGEIIIRKIYEVPPDLHARFSAISRTYRYFITLERDPFNRNYETFLPSVPDFATMNEAAEVLLGEHDFITFSKKHSDVQTHICTVTHAEWHRVMHAEGKWYFEITADRFLRNMVRCIVGTLLDVGRGKITPSDFADILYAKDRSRAGNTAPSNGLFLEEVLYPTLD